MVLRDEKGRWVKGESPNPGGKSKDGISIVSLIDSAVSEQDWKTIITIQITKAKRGDIKAAEFLFDRRFGKPAQETKLTGDLGLLVKGYSSDIDPDDWDTDKKQD